MREPMSAFLLAQPAAASWTEVGPEPGPGTSGFLPNAPVTALQLFNPDGETKNLVASTYGRGIWNYALAGGTGLCRRGNGNSKYNGSESERDLERDGNGV